MNILFKQSSNNLQFYAHTYTHRIDQKRGKKETCFIERRRFFSKDDGRTRIEREGEKEMVNWTLVHKS